MLNLILIGFLIVSFFFFPARFIDKEIIILLLGINFKVFIKYFKDKKGYMILGLLLVLYLIVAYFIHTPYKINISDMVMYYNEVFSFFVLPFTVYVILKNTKITEKQWKIIKIFIICCFIFIAYYSIYNYAFNRNLSQSGIGSLDIVGRVKGFFGNPNLYGVFLTLMISSILYWSINKKKSILNYCCLALAMLLIPFTFSRSSFIVMGLCIAILLILNIYFYAKNKDTHYKRNIIVIVLSLCSIFFVFQTRYLLYSSTNLVDKMLNTNIASILKMSNKDEELFDYIDDYNSRNNSSLNTRQLFYNVGKGIYKEHMLFGVGKPYYTSIYVPEYYKEHNIKDIYPGLPHNAYVYLLASIGLIGTILYLSIFGLLIKKNFVNLIKNKNFISTGPLLLLLVFIINNLHAEFFVNDVRVMTMFLILLAIVEHEVKIRTKKIHSIQQNTIV